MLQEDAMDTSVKSQFSSKTFKVLKYRSFCYNMKILQIANFGFTYVHTFKRIFKGLFSPSEKILFTVKG